MAGLLQRIQAGEVLVSDGGVGTMLFQRGLKAGDCPERINLDKPEILTEIAALYLDAGSDILATGTFGGSPLKLKQYSLEDSTEDINRAGVRTVRKAVEDTALIAGVVGPCGQLLKPYGDVEPQEVLDGFRRQIKALLDEGIDAIFIETMTDLSEALLALQAAKESAPSTTVSVSMTFNITPNGIFTIMGNTIEQACQELENAGADMLGSNCGHGMDHMISIAAEYAKHTGLPLIIQPNAGIPEMGGDNAVYPETPEFMAERSRQLVDIGVNVIGGCCGTTPEHIAAIRKLI